jgi:hypothetical protein
VPPSASLCLIELASASAIPGFDNPAAPTPSNVQKVESGAPLRRSVSQGKCFPGAVKRQITRAHGASQHCRPGKSSSATPSTEGKPTLSKRVTLYRSLHGKRPVPPMDTPPPAKTHVCMIRHTRPCPCSYGQHLHSEGKLTLSKERVPFYRSLHSERPVPPTDTPPPVKLVSE